MADEGYKYVDVGEFGEFPSLEYDEATNTTYVSAERKLELALNVFEMAWPNVSREAEPDPEQLEYVLGGVVPPRSVCAEPCPMGHVKSFTVSNQKYRSIFNSRK